MTTGATSSGGSGTAGSAGESTAAGSSSEGVDESGDAGGSATAGGSGSHGSGSDGGGTDGVDPGTICPDNYAAVCGVDGETYDNACSATAAGVEIERDGPCFADCEGSCTVGGSPATLALALVALLLLRPRGR